MRKLLAVTLLLGCTPKQQAEPASEPVEAKREEPPVSLPESESPSPRDDARVNADCVAIYSFDSNDSVLEEQRRRGGGARWDDFAKRYPAATIDPSTHHAVERVASTQVDGQALFWFTPGYDEAVLDATYFGDLSATNVTELQVGKRVELGTLTELGRAKLGGRELARMLLEIDAIGTYIHIGSTVCLSEDSEEQGRYQARFFGEHTYYTNEENTEAFGFVFEIDPQGHMAVTGAAPKRFSTLSSG